MLAKTSETMSFLIMPDELKEDDGHKLLLGMLNTNDGTRGSQCLEVEDHGCESDQLPVDAEIVQYQLLQLDPYQSMVTLKSNEALQRNLNKLEEWVITNSMNFNEGQSWILHLGWGSPACTDSLGNERLESSAMEGALGSWSVAS
ncbi:hypothetical protein DUI87_27003 [Hirundo rustica rustica]|uniref:Uncharacterized protein n=1 Tax=Hirundo rustica rustica TaxID=333673 RepID=A0A3M0J6M1_HIRRU|nr:hypothetical protein DUI87_27003 [Hirundo rustica rustica]